MPAISAPEPRPRRMNSRICSNGHSLVISGPRLVTAHFSDCKPRRPRGGVRRGRGGEVAPAPRPRRGQPTAQDGGCSQPASLVHCGLLLVTPPVYSKNWMRSLQTPGALEYLPQASAGAPSACGPVNALALAWIADGDRLA